MTRWLMICAGAIAALSASAAHAELLLDEDFAGEASLTERGWVVEAEPQQSQWSVEDGHLRVVCHRSPYQGGRIVRAVPVTQRGVLELDARFAQEGGVNYDHLCLGIKLYGYMTAFKKYGGHNWTVYRPEQQTWYTVSDRVPLGEWTHLRVEFDIPRSRVEYYLGDARDPLLVDTDLPMSPEGETGELEIFNYGLTKGTVTHLIDNVTLSSTEAAGEGAPGVRDLTLVFRGLTSDRYRAREILEAALGAERVLSYTLMARGAATAPRNQLALDAVPGAATWAGARRVVLEDMPAGPGEVLAPWLLEDLERSVRDGAHLLVLAGPFSLGKGAWQGTPLEAMLPVEVGGPWTLRRLDMPAPLPGGNGAASLLWCHAATPVEGASVSAAAGEMPLIVSRPYGAGAVTIFLGAPLGHVPDFGDTQPFWEWDGWPDLLGRLAGVAGGDEQ